MFTATKFCMYSIVGSLNPAKLAQILIYFLRRVTLQLEHIFKICVKLYGLAPTAPPSGVDPANRENRCSLDLDNQGQTYGWHLIGQRKKKGPPAQ